MPRVAEVVRSEMTYSAKTWDTEAATRYVLDVEGRMVEFSHFRHFSGSQYVKDVIEVASSFGCTVGCHHCAAADLPQMQALSAAEIEDCVRLIAQLHEVSSTSRVLITYSGIGEASLLRRAVFSSAQQLQAEYPKAEFVLTTVGIRPDFFSAVGRMSSRINLRYVQVSVFSSRAESVRAMMPLGARLGYDPAALVRAMRAERHLRYRLNYVVIAGLNDSPDQIEAILDTFEGVRDQSVLRVSRLNSTSASRRHGLDQPSVEDVRAVVSRAQTRGWDAYWFYSHGDDQLNCGQLAGSYLVSLGIPKVRGSYPTQVPPGQDRGSVAEASL